MQSSVPEGNLYRVGGDEFVIICPDVEEAEFRDIIQKLKDTFNREECKAAVGYEWTHSCRNLKAIIRSADQKMYEDKEQFYQQHAEGKIPPLKEGKLASNGLCRNDSYLLSIS